MITIKLNNGILWINLMEIFHWSSHKIRALNYNYNKIQGEIINRKYLFNDRIELSSMNESWQLITVDDRS